METKKLVEAFEMNDVQKIKAFAQKMKEARAQATQGQWYSGPNYGVYGKFEERWTPQIELVYSNMIAAVRIYGVGDQQFITQSANNMEQLCDMVIEMAEATQEIQAAAKRLNDEERLSGQNPIDTSLNLLLDTVAKLANRL